MKASPENATDQLGVSVITCTNRKRYLRNLLRNFSRQLHPKKELIIIINNDRIPLSPYKELASTHPNIRIFSLPERYSLGSCLNFAVGQAKHPYIAKFDDDDYYAPYYLTDSLQSLKRTKADIIGKRSHYMYLRGSKTLILRFPNEENRPASQLPGATLVFKRDVLKRVKFPDLSVAEDDHFCMKSKKLGYKVYSSGKYNFLAIRRKNSLNHTWIISDKELIAHHQVVLHVRNRKKFIQRKPRQI